MLTQDLGLLKFSISEFLKQFAGADPHMVRIGTTPRAPLLTDKSCKFSLFWVIFGLFLGYISHPAPLLPFGSRPPFLHILDPPLIWFKKMKRFFKKSVDNFEIAQNMLNFCLRCSSPLMTLHNTVHIKCGFPFTFEQEGKNEHYIMYCSNQVNVCNLHYLIVLHHWKMEVCKMSQKFQ